MNVIVRYIGLTRAKKDHERDKTEECRTEQRSPGGRFSWCHDLTRIR
ncbi:MAG: hypothetical protein QOH88_1403 [Verrucomicrobiota bacterium]